MSTYFIQKLRRAGALLLLVGILVVSFFSIFNEFTQVCMSHGENKPDGVTIWQQRMVRVLRAIPSKGTIGYLSDRDFAGLTYNPIDQDEEFVMTQYWLSPRILVEDGNQDYVIINLAYQTIPQIQQLLAKKNLRLVKSFGFGIYLGRRGLQ